MRSYIADRIRITLILAVFSIPMLALYVAQNYEDWAFADLGRATAPEYVRFRDVRNEPFMNQGVPSQTPRPARVAAAAR
jgi:hypothetical protein